MEHLELQPDFKEFLRLLNSKGVEYLIVGGYVVGFYGYPRATGDMDIWIAVNEENAGKVSSALCEFGFREEEVTPRMFLEKDQIIRMGMPPVRIEIITGASGVDFAECYARRELVKVDDMVVNLMSLDDLKRNKRASGRYKDLDDLEHLP